MRKAIHCASLTNPAILSSKVGSIVVADGIIIGEGCKKFAYVFYGNPDYGNSVLHAERVAIENAEGGAHGATLYTTLEPCLPLDYEGNHDFSCCSDLIAESGIKTVYIGMLDPNRDINGRGMDYLAEHGVNAILLPGFEDMISPLLEYERLPWKTTRGKSKDWRHLKPILGDKDTHIHWSILRRLEKARVRELMSEWV